MTEAEMHHFHSTSLSLDKLLKRAERIIRPVIAKGGKNPSTVAKHLNKVNFRTASGARWSPRLSKFLIDLIFAHRVPTPSKIDQVGPPSGNATRVTSDEIGQPLSTTSFNREQIAEKLASLGRVVVVGKGE